MNHQVDIRASQRVGGVQPAEARADDRDAMPTAGLLVADSLCEAIAWTPVMPPPRRCRSGRAARLGPRSTRCRRSSAPVFVIAGTVAWMPLNTPVRLTARIVSSPPGCSRRWGRHRRCGRCSRERRACRTSRPPWPRLCSSRTPSRGSAVAGPQKAASVSKSDGPTVGQELLLRTEAVAQTIQIPPFLVMVGEQRQ